VTQNEPASLPGRPCSVAATLSVVGDKWTLLIVRELVFGNHRFGDILRNTGAPRDRLAARLRRLEEAELVVKQRYNEHPPRFEYHLTEAGRELGPVLQLLRQWGNKWAVPQPPLTVRHHRDHELALVAHCGNCGEEVDPDTLTFVPTSQGWDLRGPVTAAGS
jgi:DNA-binding HxlR family transcriptional regulator